MPARIRIKFCGLTRPADAVEAARLGADAIGLVFYDASPRAVTRRQATSIARALPPFVTLVGLFLDPTPDAVRATVDALPIDLLQFHGSESPDFCESFAIPYIKAMPMANSIDLEAAGRRHSGARGLLLDGHAAGQPGGQGRTFTWRETGSPLPVILAGGLTVANVGAAINRVRPWAVDVSSGIESSPGIKDARRMAAFVKEVDLAA
jgi:phosphoribosylanthranilate isomerase